MVTRRGSSDRDDGQIGSLEADLPVDNLKLFNCNYFIVSQTNPHIVPLLRVKRWFTSCGRSTALLAYFVE